MGLECYIVVVVPTIKNSTNLTSNDMSLVKRNMYNARRKLMPPVPTLRPEVISSLIQIAPKTIRDESFLIYLILILRLLYIVVLQIKLDDESYSTVLLNNKIKYT